MNQPNVRALTLFDLITRVWQAPAPVAAVRFAADGAATAFATGDGAVMIAAAPDPEPPETRIRVTGDLGQTTIRPRSKDPAPLITVSGLADGAPPLATGAEGFLAGDANGRVLRIGLDGSAEPTLLLERAIVALDVGHGAIAATDGLTLARLDRDGATREALPGIRALALGPRGALAVAEAERVLLMDAEGRRAATVAGATGLRWRGEGDWLAATLGRAGLALIAAGAPERPVRLDGFPAPVRDMAWSAPGRAFFAAGAFRVAGWDATALPATDHPLVTGQPGLVTVEAVAAHPLRPIVAAGYANGQVILSEIGKRDELLLRQAGGAVTCLGFSPDGRHLAIGDADGQIAISTFPDRMFK